MKEWILYGLVLMEVCALSSRKQPASSKMPVYRAEMARVMAETLPQQPIQQLRRRIAVAEKHINQAPTVADRPVGVIPPPLGVYPDSVERKFWKQNARN